LVRDLVVRSLTEDEARGGGLKTLARGDRPHLRI